MIDNYNNEKKEVEIRISQGLPGLPIFFLIYIHRMYE